jgi:hypothetical protein
MRIRQTDLAAYLLARRQREDEGERRSLARRAPSRPEIDARPRIAQVRVVSYHRGLRWHGQRVSPDGAPVEGARGAGYSGIGAVAEGHEAGDVTE